MKLVMGTVATALVRKRDAPELYSEVNPAGLCALCSTREIDGEGRPRLVTGPEETLEHVLTCPSAVATEARTAAEARIAATVSEALEGAQKRSVPHALSRSLKMCVLRGLPPAGLTDMVRETVPDAKKAAQVVRKLATAIGEQAHKTWAARCQAYAEWEKAKRADPEPRQRERCRECDDYGWVRASAAMQVYDHTNRTQHQQLEAAEATAGGGQ
eukprot:tig00000093_g3497.t1